MRRIAVTGACLAVLAAGTAAAAEQRYETADWVFVAPSEIGTAGDLELAGRAVQLCTDEIEKLLGHRPAIVPRFTMQWLPSTFNGSGATQTGVLNWFSPGFRLVEDSARRFRESVVAQRLCFGPHEVTHVLSWDSFRIGWASEGFAEYTDRLYETTAWRCCAPPSTDTFRCDETGYARYSARVPYADLSPFVRTTESYNTAACFWWEAQRVGGFPGLRAVLASMRARSPLTTGELAVQHANAILGVDLRPALLRYGFTPDELTAPPPPPGPRLCTRIGTESADVLGGTARADVLCGLAGADRLSGGAGADVFRAGAGADTVGARDGSADAVACGPGRDTAVVDRRDRVNRDCERVRRR